MYINKLWSTTLLFYFFQYIALLQLCIIISKVVFIEKSPNIADYVAFCTDDLIFSIKC